MVAAVVTITDEKVIAALGLHADILDDPAGSLNINQITSPEYAAQFRPSREAVPNVGYTRSAVWVRLKLKNLTFSDVWNLQAAYSGMDIVELYSENGSNWEVRELGQSLRFSTRSIINPNLLFRLNLPFGKEQTFYLRYRNDAGLTLPLRLFSYQQYQIHALGEQLVFGIFFGFVLVLSLYNLILFVKIRDLGYLFYFLYTAGYGLFQFSLYGLAYQYLWPESPGWAVHNIPFFLAMAFFWRLLFTMTVLDSRVNFPGMHRILTGMLVALVVASGYHALEVGGLLPGRLALGPELTLRVGSSYFAAFTAAVMVLSFRCLRKGVQAARTFMLAWIFMATGLIVYALKCLGFLPSNFLTEYGLLFGFIGEMCLLFVSLGESIQAIRTEAREKSLRQQAAVQAYQEEQIRSIRLELELIKANIQPHFMLNSINAAIMWIGEEPRAAVKLLHALSQELKQLLKIVGEKVIPVREEVRMCRMHLEVMSLRHDKAFALRLEDVKEDEMIPPMVIHTLVENGLTHGYAGKDSGIFVLSRSEDAQGVHLALFNDGKADHGKARSGGLGLQYVRARLEEVYSKRWRLDSHAVDGGWRVTLSIPHGKGGYPTEAVAFRHPELEASR
jgi:hypothetical protein